MIALISRHKRLLGLMGCFLIFFLGGITLLEQEVEVAGGIGLASAFGILAYAPITWLLKRFKYFQISPKWINKEVWAALLVLTFLSILGLMESYAEHPEFILLFLLVFIFVLLLSALHFRNNQLSQQGVTTIDKEKIQQIAFWTFAIGMGALLMVFESYDRQDALVFTALIYFPMLFFLTLRWLFRQIRFILNLKNERAKTELLHLKSQVNPHFFFNMLNNLYGLVEKDGKKARSLILKLSDLMRYSIYEGQKEKVTLEEEIEYLKNFVELNQMRYHKAITIDFDTQIHREGIKIMPLLFIILLENAFKHGVERLRKDAFVHIKMQTDEQSIYFEVVNNFDPAETSSTGGIGLANLRRRLELVYPNKHSLAILESQSVYTAKLSIQL